MAWKDVLPVEERIRFAVLAARGTGVFSDLCEQFGISRKAGYEWLRRYCEFGLAGPYLSSSAPHQTTAGDTRSEG